MAPYLPSNSLGNCWTMSSNLGLGGLACCMLQIWCQSNLSFDNQSLPIRVRPYPLVTTMSKIHLLGLILDMSSGFTNYRYSITRITFSVTLDSTMGTDPNSFSHISSGITVASTPVSSSILQEIPLILTGTRISSAFLFEGLLMANIGHSPRNSSLKQSSSLGTFRTFRTFRTSRTFKFYSWTFLFFLKTLVSFSLPSACLGLLKTSGLPGIFWGHFGLMCPFLLQVWHSESFKYGNTCLGNDLCLPHLKHSWSSTLFTCLSPEIWEISYQSTPFLLQYLQPSSRLDHSFTEQFSSVCLGAYTTH